MEFLLVFLWIILLVVVYGFMSLIILIHSYCARYICLILVSKFVPFDFPESIWFYFGIYLILFLLNSIKLPTLNSIGLNKEIDNEKKYYYVAGCIFRIFINPLIFCVIAKIISVWFI